MPSTWLAAGFIDPLRLLWILLLLPAAFLFRRLAPRRPLLRLLGRAVVVALLVVALARPKHVEEVHHLGTAFVLDVSRSIPAAKREQALAQIERWFEKTPPGDQVSLVLFGDRPSVEVPFGRPRGKDSDAGFGARLDRIESRVVPKDSDLARAVEFVEGTFPEGVAKRIVLISDGNQTRGDLHQAAQALAASRVRLDYLPIEYAFENEVIVEGLTGSGRGRIGEPTALRATISAETPTDAEVSLYVNGRPAGPPEQVKLKSGTNVLRFSPRPTERGYLQYDLRVRAERDGNAANNVGRAGVLVGGSPRVLVVAENGQDERIADTLRDLGVTIERITPRDLPVHPGGYVDVDAVVLNDVPAYSLDELRQSALRDAVKELGTGLLIAGGPHSFGPGGYRGTALAEVIPVDLDATNRKSFPKGALAIVLHSIEFDSGNTWAVKICKSAMQSMNDDDVAGVVIYSMTGEHWLFPLTPLRDRDRLYSLIDGCSPGDMMSLHNSFGLIETAFNASDAAVKHIVVVSDGDPTMPAPELLDRLVAGHVTVSCICIEPHGPLGSRPMQTLATQGGGRFYELKPSLGELEDLPRLMLKEAATLRRASIIEKNFVPSILLPNSPMIRGFGSAVPPLGGYVVTSMRSGAETILLANEEEKDPLLASWYAGLGRVTAFTSDASSRWAKEWLKWGGFAPFWAELCRAVLPPSPEASGAAEVKTEGDQLRLAWDLRDASDAPIVKAAARAVVIGSGGEPVRFELLQEEPGRYVARTGAMPAGHYIVHFDAQVDGKRYDAREAAAIDYAPEERALASNIPLLARAASATGGKRLGPEDDPFKRDFDRVLAEIEIRSWIICAAIILLVLELADRRFGLAPAKRLRSAFARLRVRAPRPRPAPAAAASAPRTSPIAPPHERRGADLPPMPANEPAAPPSPAAKDTEPDHLDALKKARDQAQKKREWR